MYINININNNYTTMENSSLILPQPLENICFPVYQISPEEYFSSEGSSEKHSSLIFPDTASTMIVKDNNGSGDEILAFLGQKYEFKSNRELAESALEQMKSLFGRENFKIKTSNWKNRRFTMNFILSIQDKKLSNVGDILKYRITITNSYDGGLKHSVSAGFERLVCKNGLTAFDIEISNSKKHTKNNTFDIVGIENSLSLLNTKIELFDTMSERVVTPKEWEDIKENIKKKTTFPSTYFNQAEVILRNEMHTLGYKENNAWLTYNALNNIINHHLNSGSYDQGAKASLDKKIISNIYEVLELSY